MATGQEQAVAVVMGLPSNGRSQTVSYVLRFTPQKGREPSIPVPINAYIAAWDPTIASRVRELAPSERKPSPASTLSGEDCQKRFSLDRPKSEIRK